MTIQNQQMKHTYFKKFDRGTHYLFLYFYIKTIVDGLSKAVITGLQGSLQTAFIESMSNTLIPAYEKSSQNMFKQLHEAFSVGIKECK